MGRSVAYRAMMGVLALSSVQLVCCTQNANSLTEEVAAKLIREHDKLPGPSYLPVNGLNENSTLWREVCSKEPTICRYNRIELDDGYVKDLKGVNEILVDSGAGIARVKYTIQLNVSDHTRRLMGIDRKTMDQAIMAYGPTEYSHEIILRKWDQGWRVQE